MYFSKCFLIELPHAISNINTKIVGANVGSNIASRYISMTINMTYMITTNPKYTYHGYSLISIPNIVLISCILK